MVWPRWNDVKTKAKSAESTKYDRKSSRMDIGVTDTVDSFKLKPSKGRQSQHRGLLHFNPPRQSAFDLGHGLNPWSLKRHTSLLYSSYEPHSLSEFKRLRYITNRDLHHRKSTIGLAAEEKSGVHDKHCLFVSITGITLKVGVGKRRPVAPCSKHNWNPKFKDRIPQNALHTARFSIRLSDEDFTNKKSKQTMDKNVSMYLSSDKAASKKTVGGLRRPLELQARDLYERFSDSSSLESLNVAKPSLNFIWEEMGLNLAPLSSAQTSLYKVLTHDQVKVDKDTRTQKRTKKEPASDMTTEHKQKSLKKKSPKPKKGSGSPDMDRFYHSSTDDSALLGGSDETKKKKDKNRLSDSILQIRKHLISHVSQPSEGQSKISEDLSQYDSPHTTLAKEYSSFEEIMESTIPFQKDLQDNTVVSTRSSAHQRKPELPRPDKVADRSATLPAGQSVFNKQKPAPKTLESDTYTPSASRSETQATGPRKTELEISLEPEEHFKSLPSSGYYTPISPTTPSRKVTPQTKSKEDETSKTMTPGLFLEAGEEESFHDCISDVALAYKRLPRQNSNQATSPARPISSIFARIFSTRSTEKEHCGEVEDVYFSPESLSASDLTPSANLNEKWESIEDFLSETSSTCTYFSPKNYSQPDLENISNSNSAPKLWMLYHELLMTQLELKQLLLEKKHLKEQLKSLRATTEH